MYVLGAGVHIGGFHATRFGIIAVLGDLPEPDQSSARRIAAKPTR